MPARIAARPLLLAGPAAVAGVLAGPATIAGWCALPSALAAALLLGLATRRVLPVHALLVALVALAAGFAAGARLQERTDAVLRLRHLTAEPWPRAPPRNAVAVTVLQVVRAEEDPFRNRARLDGRDRRGVGFSCAWDGRLPSGVEPGARVRVAGRFYLPRPPTNPGEFDARTALARRGIALRAELRAASNVELLARPAARWSNLWCFKNRLARARRAAAVRLRGALPPDVAPLAAALVLGIRSGIGDEERILFERTGTLHVLAISGMHVVLLAGMVHALLRRLGAGPRTAAAITLALVLLYVPLAGAAAPIRRAATVLLFYGLALVRGRPPDPASALGGAALLLALLDPAEVFRVGFRLSFVASAGIAWLSGPWRARWSRRYRLLRRFPAVQRDRRFRLAASRYLLDAFPVSLAAWCSTQGLVARAFGVVTPAGPLVNVAIGPLVALLLPLIALVALGVTPLAGAVTLIVRLLKGLLEAGAVLPGGFFLVVPPPLWSVALWGAGCAALRRSTPLGLLLLGAASATLLTELEVKAPELVMLEVGNGQAILLRHPDGSTVLVDAGSRTRPALARRVVLPALRELGVTRIDTVVCTHQDSDHWSALPHLLALVPVRSIVLGHDPPRAVLAAARRYGVAVRRPRPGDAINRSTDPSRCVLRLLAGDGAGNDGSLALLWDVQGQGRRVLLPADREEHGLLELIRTGVPRADVVVAPHHGARCRAAAAFGGAARPRLLLVSAARGFADPSTVEAYGADEVWRTSRRGAIRVTLSREGIRARATIPAPCAP